MSTKALCLLLSAAVVADAWYFRGTSNQWGATQLVWDTTKGMLCTDVYHQENGYEFKISRSAYSWAEAYPSSNWVIHEGAGDYSICFKESTKEIIVDKHQHWYFRGTPNQWGATGMLPADDGKFCTSQYFARNGDGFKVSASPDNYDVSFPKYDWIIHQGAGTYTVCFDSLYKSITVDKQPETPVPVVEAPIDGVPADEVEEWFFRGTTNKWGATKLQPKNGLLCIDVYQRDRDEFKISRFADNWDEAYPSSNWVIFEGAGDYSICFKESTKDIIVDKHEHWYFRGTPNQWGATEMTVASDGRFCTSQYFARNGDGFKVSGSPDNYDVSFPKYDWIIYQGAGTYTVCFDSLWKTIDVVKTA